MRKVNRTFFVFMLLCGAAAARAQCTCDEQATESTGRWEQIYAATSPPGRMHHEFVYDGNREVAVLVGGAVSCADRTLRTDFTWEFDGEDWVEITTDHVPPLRWQPALSYDFARERVVMFGGTTDSEGFGDTWEYDGTDWVEILTENSPGICDRVAMAYDPDRQVSVLKLGANDGHNRCPNQYTTWEYDGLDWTQVGSAGPEDTGAFYWDSARSRMLFFGGGVWEYEGGEYTLLQHIECSDRTIGYDSSQGTFIQCDGSDPGGPCEFEPTWEWKGAGCAEYRMQSSFPEPRKTSRQEIFHEPSGSVILFGGFEYCTGQTFRDTWRYFQDRDEDGVADAVDNCADVANPEQVDCDADGTGDVCDADASDIDGDAVDDACDNCPDHPNSDQADSDAVVELIIDEDFDESLAVGSWSLNGSATHDLGQGVLRLTGRTQDQAGSAFLIDQRIDHSYTATFRFHMTHLGGADGMTFTVNRGGASDVGGLGIGLGFAGIDGLAVEFDTYENACDPNGNHVGFDEPELSDDCPDSLVVNDGVPELAGNGWYDARVEFDRGDLRVFLANPSIGYPETEVLTYTYSSHVPTPSYFGFTAGTGSQHNNHLVDDFWLEVSTVWGDGVGDVCDNCPYDVNSDQADRDSDGVGDVCDNCPDQPNAEQEDAEGDGTGDVCDPDDDNDGISDLEDNCPKAHNPSQADGDVDGIGDECDVCPSDYDPAQEDADADGVGDSCDECTDTDEDGYGDPGYPPNTCQLDNCPSEPNPDQADKDDDDRGDVCDNCPEHYNPDQLNHDEDSLGNSCDNCLTVDNEDQVNTDGDSHGDACDNCPETYSENYDDQDGDGWGDVCDNCLSRRNESQHDLDEDNEGDECDLDDGVVFFRKIGHPRVRWQSDPAYSLFNLYRGSLAELLGDGSYTQPPGSNPYADRFCDLSVTAIDDALEPMTGEAFYWLVTGEGVDGEEDLGNGTDVSRENSNACP